MRFVKIGIAAILLLCAIFLAIGEFNLLVDPVARKAVDEFGDPQIPWQEHVSVILLISLLVCAAYLLWQRPRDPVAEVHCPRCMAVGGHSLAPSYGRSVNPVAWHFGGFLLSIVYSGSKQQRFRCRECAEFFYAHTPTSRGYRLLFLLFVALIAVNIFAGIIDLWSSD